jgi:hypothetical protein
MIFNVPGHIEMIRNGLSTYPPLASGLPHFIVKTETRRPNRGIYKVGKDYAVQSKRGVKAETDIRIVMDKIWEEEGLGIAGGIPAVGNRANDTYISKEDALAEGGYIPKQFEELFNLLNPKRDWTRWAFQFHVIEVKQ